MSFCKSPIEISYYHDGRREVPHRSLRARRGPSGFGVMVKGYRLTEWLLHFLPRSHKPDINRASVWDIVEPKDNSLTQDRYIPQPLLRESYTIERPGPVGTAAKAGKSGVSCGVWLDKRTWAGEASLYCLRGFTISMLDCT